MNICCLCLVEKTNCLNIFDGYNSTISSHDNLSVLIAKYFWFEPQENAFISRFICSECWSIIKNFHELYKKVEEAHNLYLQNKSYLFDVKNKTSLEFIKQEKKENLHISDDGDSENKDDIFEDETEVNYETIKVLKDEQELVCSTNRRTTRSKNANITKSTTEHIRRENIQNKNNAVIDDEVLSTGRTRSKAISERAIQSHEYDKKVSSFMTLTCDLCSEVLVTFGKLKTHFQKVHNLNGYAVCCNRKHYKRNLLIDHIDTHLNPDHFKCPTCGKTFTNKESHQTHIKTFHLPERVVYECDECPKKFSWRYVLLAHKKTHAPKEDWKYKCKDCDKTFASHTFLSSHKHYVHKVTKKICDLCGKSVSNTSFRKHQLKHSGIVQPKIQCEICGSWLNRKYIKIHLKNHEESGIDHICIHCGKKSPNSKALYKHIYEVHTLKKTLKCNVCEKTFKSKDLLTQHMPVHTGENNFSCQYCPRTFKFKSNWHDHKKKEHPFEFEEERQKRLSKMNLNNSDEMMINKLNVVAARDSLKMEENL